MLRAGRSGAITMQHEWVEEEYRWFVSDAAKHVHYAVNGGVSAFQVTAPGQTIAVTVGSGAQTSVHPQTTGDFSGMWGDYMNMPSKNEICESCFMTRAQYNKYPGVECWPEFGVDTPATAS